MKTYSQEQLKALAAPYFDTEPEQKTIFATSDGSFFWPNNKGFAHAHAQRNQLEVIEIQKEAEPEKAPEPKKPTASKKKTGSKKSTKTDDAPQPVADATTETESDSDPESSDSDAGVSDADEASAE